MPLGPVLPLLALLAATPAAAPASPASPATPARPAPPPPAPALTVSPFRLALTYVGAFSQDGDLVDARATPHALGIDMAMPSTNYARNHLGLATQWEAAPAPGAATARGFRIDLIAIGFPI